MIPDAWWHARSEGLFGLSATLGEASKPNRRSQAIEFRTSRPHAVLEIAKKEMIDV